MRVGVVGHRFLSTGAAGLAERVCARLLTQLRAEGLRPTALSALAEGADTLFARVALASDVPLEVVQPHGEYLDDFATTPARAEYLLMWRTARRRSLMPYRHRSDAAYQAAMRWVADRSDLLVAIWDGRPSLHIGGTADTVMYACTMGCPVVHVHSRAERVLVV